MNAPLRGRGAASNPANRFEPIAYQPDPAFAEAAEDSPGPPTQYFRDSSRTILTDNESPDIPLERSLNPYKGCSHGCSYCFARPTHEYLGLSAGLDFESKIFVKENAPALLREALMRPSYRVVSIGMSGTTDPYQPVEKELRITRGCLEVLAEFRHPVCIITKSALVERDIDLLADLAKDDLASVSFSITTLDHDLQRRLEPRASTPRARFAAIRKLTDAGIPVGVNLAPVIPGLTDHEIPALLKASAESGALRAGRVILRLPHGVKEIFSDWLEAHYPLKKEKVLSKLRQLHGGKLYDSGFGQRLTGQGPLADQIDQLFGLHCRRNGLNRETNTLDCEKFRRPASGQLELF